MHAIGYRHQNNLLHILINHLKFYGYKANAISLAALLWGELGNNVPVFKGYDMLFPVPRTSEDVLAKGDPLSLVFGLAKSFLDSTGPLEISERMIYGSEPILTKTLATEKSPGMTLAKKRDLATAVLRGEAPSPYMVSDPSRVASMRLLAVDDVFTSGYHTMFPLCHTLLAAGASSVDVLVLGRHKWSY